MTKFVIRQVCAKTVTFTKTIELERSDIIKCLYDGAEQEICNEDLLAKFVEWMYECSALDEWGAEEEEIDSDQRYAGPYEAELKEQE